MKIRGDQLVDLQLTKFTCVNGLSSMFIAVFLAHNNKNNKRYVLTGEDWMQEYANDQGVLIH